VVVVVVIAQQLFSNTMRPLKPIAGPSRSQLTDWATFPARLVPKAIIIQNTAKNTRFSIAKWVENVFVRHVC